MLFIILLFINTQSNAHTAGGTPNRKSSSFKDFRLVLSNRKESSQALTLMPPPSAAAGGATSPPSASAAAAAQAAAAAAAAATATQATSTQAAAQAALSASAALTASPSLPPPAPSSPVVRLPPAQLPAAPPTKLWRERPDVIASGLLTSKTKHELQRQEQIAELVYSEEAYVADVRALLHVYLLPLEAHARSCEFKSLAPMLPRDKIKRMHDTAQALVTTAGRFISALKARQDQAMYVETVADILTEHSQALKKAFFDFCETSAEFRPDLDSKNPELVTFLNERKSDRKNRGLQIDAFLLAPVQRLARYPLLLEVI